MTDKSSPPAPSPDGEGVSDSLPLGAAPKGRPVNNPVRKRGDNKDRLYLSRGTMPVHNGTPVHRASVGRFVLHPRANAAKRNATRGYSYFAPPEL